MNDFANPKVLKYLTLDKRFLSYKELWPRSLLLGLANNEIIRSLIADKWERWITCEDLGYVSIWLPVRYFGKRSPWYFEDRVEIEEWI